MNQIESYIQTLKIDEVPWHRLTTAYGRASDFSKLFQQIQDMSKKSAVKSALDHVLSDIEHQGTFWHSTPFAMIFLARLFCQCVPEADDSECAALILEELLDFFNLAAELHLEDEELYDETPLPHFSDMLKEEYLWSEIYVEEEDEERYEEGEVFPDDLFYSFYYYSYQAIQYCRPALKKLEQTSFREAAEKLLELL